MVQVNGSRWRDRRRDLRILRSEAATQLECSEGHLRNVEGGHAEPGEDLILRAARLYKCTFKWLTSQEDGVPDEPPSSGQERETNTGPGRSGGNKGRGGKDGKGPKRLQGAA